MITATDTILEMDTREDATADLTPSPENKAYDAHHTAAYLPLRRNTVAKTPTISAPAAMKILPSAFVIDSLNFGEPKVVVIERAPEVSVDIAPVDDVEKKLAAKRQRFVKRK